MPRLPGALCLELKGPGVWFSQLLSGTLQPPFVCRAHSRRRGTRVAADWQVSEDYSPLQMAVCPLPRWSRKGLQQVSKCHPLPN